MTGTGSTSKELERPGAEDAVQSSTDTSQSLEDSQSTTRVLGGHKRVRRRNGRHTHKGTTTRGLGDEWGGRVVLRHPSCQGGQSFIDT